MKKLIVLLALFTLSLFFISCSVNQQSNLSTSQSDVGTKGKIDKEVLKIKEGLPEGWGYELVTDKTKMNKLKGLEQATAQIYFFSNINSSKTDQFGPSLILFFYDIKEKDRIMAVIKEESIYSSNIPIYFDETKNYIILTSPYYVSEGHVKGSAPLTQPLYKSLKIFFNKYKK